jgi:penicillin-binding protein-related factor A (putative recombinase)
MSVSLLLLNSAFLLCNMYVPVNNLNFKMLSGHDKAEYIQQNSERRSSTTTYTGSYHGQYYKRDQTQV